MSTAATIGKTIKQRARRVAIGTPLAPAQIRWLGVLLVAALLPQMPYVPAWVAGTGAMLIGLRFVLLARDRLRGGVAPARIPAWALALFALAAGLVIRQTFGYFLGRDPCIAFLFLLVGIKYLEARITRDGALLVCLASFLVVTPFFYGQSMFAALAAVPVMLLLGATLLVLTIAPQSAPQPSQWGAPVALSCRLFVQGIPLAALLFVLFPRLGAPLWGLPVDRTGKAGLSERMAPGEITALSMSDTVAFRVDFDGPPPLARYRYWRGPVLTRFDGREWTMLAQPLDGELARFVRRPTDRSAPPAGTFVSYTVTLEPHWKPWLFALDMPASLPRRAMEDAGAEGGNLPLAELSRDQMLLARAPVTQPLRYRQTSLLRSAHPAMDAEVDAQSTFQYLQLPAGARSRNPRTLEFAAALRDANPDDDAFIRAVLAYFRNENFVYTLEPGIVFDRDPVDGFMFQSRRGFCEHYASAFVVMLRAAGIPARVVTGFQGGEINPNGGYLIVRNSDAHAWAEALIHDQWQRFDPTAAVAPSRVEIGLGASLPAGEHVPLLARLDDNWLKHLRLSWDALNYDWRRNVVGFNRDRQRSLWRDWKIDRFAAWQIAAGASLFALVWVGAVLGWLAWKRRHSDRARALWEGLCARLARAGLPRHPYEGPLSYVARASARWPEYAPAFSVIGEAYASLRYGPAAARADTDRERAIALAHLARAVDILPAPAALRSL